MVIRNTQGAEGVLKQYEECLREVHTVPSDVKEVETYRAKLKVNNTWLIFLPSLFLQKSYLCYKELFSIDSV